MNRYHEFEDKERVKLIDEITKDVNGMSLNELTALKMISSNIGRFIDFLAGVRLFFMRDF
jgi:hypothetical protein